MIVLKYFLISIVLIYLVVLILVYFNQAKLIFHPSKLTPDYKFELGDLDKELFLKTDDGETINAIHFCSNNTRAVLYFHGNAGVLNSWQNTYSHFEGMRTDLLVIDYRGYGKSTGTPTEQGLYLDAEAAYKYLLEKGYNKDSIIVYGRSLGSGVASYMAAKYGCKKLILETPYTSMVNISKSIHPYFFPEYTLKHRFSNIRYMPQIKADILILHGTHDALIPISHCKEIYEATKTHSKLVLIQDGEHNNLPTFSEYTIALREFLK